MILGSVREWDADYQDDPPSRVAWTHDAINGFAAYEVADSVQTHEG